MTEATALIARPRAVFSALAQQAPVLLAVVIPPSLVALLTGQQELALSFLGQIAFLLVMTLYHRNSEFPQDLRQIEALVTFALLFVIASLLVVPPFVILGMPLWDALFEAVSGITSTGLTVASDAESWPIAGHLLRGWIQWCGGFAIAFAGLAIFSGSPGASATMGDTSFSARDNNSSLRMQARQVLLAYAALTGVAILACLLVIPNWWEAASVALAAVSTGGFTPRADSLASYTPLAQGIVLMICILAAISLMVYVQIPRDGLRGALRKSHVAWTLTLIFGGTLVFAGIDYTVNQSPMEEIYRGALNFISGFTTAGFSTGEVSSHVALLPLILIAMFIGGDIGSTGGGIKVGRLIMMVQVVRLTFVRVSVPASAVTYLRDRGSRVAADHLIAVGTLIALYLLSMVIGWIIFLISDAPPLAALFEVTSALSTVGLSQGLTGPEMTLHLKLTLIALMLLGRLEFIALIILFLPGTWLRRS